MQILDETHSALQTDFATMYLSEKTIGLILIGIPFISTHSYPLEILEQLLGVEPHPFMEDFKKHKGNSNLFTEFVEKFMDNYDENYLLCKEWSNKCHELFLNKLNTENSLLDLMIDGFNKEEYIKEGKKLLLPIAVVINDNPSLILVLILFSYRPINIITNLFNSRK